MKNILKNKNVILAVVGILCGSLLFISGISNNKNSSGSTEEKKNYTSDELQTYTEALENKISEFLENIGGVSNVSVIVTIDSSSETVYAKEGVNSDYVIIKDSTGNENTVPLTEITAKIRGIAVVCDYGKDEKIKRSILELLCSTFDIGSNRVSVLST